MPEIREINYATDIPGICVLLTNTFKIPFTESFFEWKHRDNPFGRSFGLIYEDEGKIAAVRMFMRWQFSNGEKNIEAIRPVDTAVDEAYRGKGLFQKLTLDGLERTKGSFDLVFNTPNMNSRGGYLKMGWNQLQTDLSYQFAVLNPFVRASSITKIPLNEIKSLNNGSGFSTNKSSEFLTWRYADAKYRSYRINIGGKDVFVICRIDKIRRVPTMIISELLGDPALFRQALNALGGKLLIPFVYFVGSARLGMPNFRIQKERSKAFIVVKDDQLRMAEHIAFSLGDLESIL
jgi:hypothetical protein